MRLRVLLVCLGISIASAAVGPVVGTVSAQSVQVGDTRAAPPPGSPNRAPTPGTNPRWTLWSFVNGANRQTVRSAQVTLKQPDGTQQKLTMTDGQWLAVSAAGRYEVTVSADGLQTVSGSFDTTLWTSNHAITITFNPGSADERATLVVAVLDQATNLPINGATVSITGPGGTRTATVGPPQSTAVLLNLPSGNYSVTASMSGYDTATADAQVTSPQQSATYVRLKKAGTVPLPPRPTPMKVMRNLVGSTEKDATSWLMDVGLTWTVKYASAPQQEGRVIAQSVPAGRSTAGPVELTVGQK